LGFTKEKINCVNKHIKNYLSYVDESIKFMKKNPITTKEEQIKNFTDKIRFKVY